VHYYANNSIAPVAITGQGVGSYAAAHIEAENFMRLDGAARKTHDAAGRFGVRVESSAALTFPHVLGLPPASAGAATLEVRSRGGAGAVTLRAGAGGAALAAGSLRRSSGADAYASSRCAFDAALAASLASPSKIAALAAPEHELELVLEVAAAQEALVIDSLSVVSA
jgi:hypothetical protein